MRLRVRDRTEFSRDELERLRQWLEVAYDEGPWRAEHWDDLGPGPHVVVEDDDGAVLAHACVAWVPIEVGGRTLATGYLEDVATRVDARGRGLGAAVVAAAQQLIEAGADAGFLATGSQPFYERLGWVRWRGPSAVREPDGAVTPTPDEDPFIMALRFEHTPAWVSEELPIVRRRRDPDEAW